MHRLKQIVGLSGMVFVYHDGRSVLAVLREFDLASEAGSGSSPLVGRQCREVLEDGEVELVFLAVVRSSIPLVGGEGRSVGAGQDCLFSVS